MGLNRNEPCAMANYQHRCMSIAGYRDLARHAIQKLLLIRGAAGGFRMDFYFFGFCSYGIGRLLHLYNRH